MSGNSRVIFSVYQEVKDHSVTSYKKQQLHLYKEKLMRRQNEYAKFCQADYFVYETDEFLIDDYTTIQFMKIKQFEELAKQYEEVLYLDLDVVPFTFVDFFKKNDLSKICFYRQNGKEWGLDRYFRKWELYNRLDCLDHQNAWVKACAKNSMLHLKDKYDVNEMLINTGVLGGNSEAIEKIKFTENLNDMIELLYEAKEDNVYPREIADKMTPNNEVFLSYLIEKNNIEFNDLHQKWNFIVDDITSNLNTKKINPVFVHVINKNFENYNKWFNLF